MPITAALRDQVVSKMQRLDKYLDQLNVIHVELCTEPTKSASDHNSVEATATVRGRTIRVRTSNADMYAAIDESVDKLYRQLNRTKERMKTHSGASLANSLPADVVGAGRHDAMVQTSPATSPPSSWNGSRPNRCSRKRPWANWSPAITPSWSS